MKGCGPIDFYLKIITFNTDKYTQDCTPSTGAAKFLKFPVVKLSPAFSQGWRLGWFTVPASQFLILPQLLPPNLKWPKKCTAFSVKHLKKCEMRQTDFISDTHFKDSLCFNTVNDYHSNAFKNAPSSPLVLLKTTAIPWLSQLRLLCFSSEGSVTQQRDLLLFFRWNLPTC